MGTEKTTPLIFHARVVASLNLSVEQEEMVRAEIESLYERGFAVEQAARFLRKQVRPWP